MGVMGVTLDATEAGVGLEAGLADGVKPRAFNRSCDQTQQTKWLWLRKARVYVECDIMANGIRYHGLHCIIIVIILTIHCTLHCGKRRYALRFSRPSWSCAWSLSASAWPLWPTSQPRGPWRIPPELGRWAPSLRPTPEEWRPQRVLALEFFWANAAMNGIEWIWIWMHNMIEVIDLKVS